MRCDQLVGEEEKEDKPVSVQAPDSPDRPVKCAEDDSLADSHLAADKKPDSEYSEANERTGLPTAGEPLVKGNSREEDDGKGENEKTAKSKKRGVAHSRHPDGGYGWVIVFAAILQQVRCHLIYFSYVKTLRFKKSFTGELTFNAKKFRILADLDPYP
jgi:hypothetical protein